MEILVVTRTLEVIVLNRLCTGIICSGVLTCGHSNVFEKCIEKWNEFAIASHLFHLLKINMYVVICA